MQITGNHQMARIVRHNDESVREGYIRNGGKEVKLFTSSLKAFQCNNRIVMAQRKHLDDFLCGRIIGRLECGRTQLEVSEELGIAQSVISRLWQRFQDDGNVSRCYSTGRPRVTTPNEDRYLAVTAKRNRRSTASDLSPQLSSATAWSREHALWTPQQWSCVMFSDESRFSLQSDSRRTFIWRAPGTRYHQENTIERHRYGGAGWLVWGGIILGSRTDLHVQSVTMTGHIYRDVILEQHVRLFRGAMGAEFLFMDDNARPHRANIVDECLQSEDITRMDWLAYSPDLNPIEHVWDMLGRRIADRQLPPTCLPELRRALLAEWCNIPQDQIGERVNLIITHLFMPDSGRNCSSASLIIYDGDQPDSPLNQQICGTRSPPPILSRGSIMHVVLTRGVFRATYGPASTHCGGAYKSPEGTFGSPGYPNNYDMDTECVWTIEAAVGNRVHLAFETFNLEDSDYCNKDYVEIHEESESGKFIGRYCGSRLPSNLTDAPKLWIKFRSDDIDTQRGFLAHFELKREVILNAQEGEIASPGYPDLYHGREEFRWTVYVPFGMRVSVQFTEIAITNISPESGCVSQVQIFDGMDDQAPSLGAFCGYQLPEPVISTGSVIYIKFEPKFYHYTGKFYLKWIATSESGIVVDLPQTPQ
ncbi:Cubilin, partial [Araneus ventricosus]